MSAGTVATDVARGVVGFISTPEGRAALDAGALALGGPIVEMIEHYGVLGLGAILTVVTKPEISDEDCRQYLADHGLKVPVYDPNAMAVGG